MGLTESDTRAKLIDSAIHARGWTEEQVRREETAGAVEIIDGRPRKKARGRFDYVLQLKASPDSPPMAYFPTPKDLQIRNERGMGFDLILQRHFSLDCLIGSWFKEFCRNPGELALPAGSLKYVPL